MPMKEVEGGTGVKQQGSFLKVRTDAEGRGSEANIMPTGSSKSEGKYLRGQFGSLGVDAPIQAGEGSPEEAPRTPLKGYQPSSKGIKRILSPKEKPSNKPTEKSKPKRSKIKKESYEPFLKIIPF